jgi:hypothetical protein
MCDNHGKHAQDQCTTNNYAKYRYLTPKICSNQIWRNDLYHWWRCHWTDQQVMFTLSWHMILPSLLCSLILGFAFLHMSFGIMITFNKFLTLPFDISEEWACWIYFTPYKIWSVFSLLTHIKRLQHICVLKVKQSHHIIS